MVFSFFTPFYRNRKKQNKKFFLFSIRGRERNKRIIYKKKKKNCEECFFAMNE